MKKTKVSIYGLTVVCILLLALLLTSVGSAQIQGCEIQQKEIVNIGGVNYLLDRCVDQAPPTATATTIPPTTIPPTATPPSQGVDPFPEAELCAFHDPRAYHTLWDSSGCHYDHFHGDDPHELDDVFGDYAYTAIGYDHDGYAEVGYLWETPNENLNKHRGYVWKTGKNLGCTALFGLPGCTTDFRVLAHGMANAHGATTATHSFWLEARVCTADGQNCGIMRTGGWQGPASLTIDDQAFLLDRRGLDVYGNVNPFPTDGQRQFLHYYATGNDCCGTWYTGQRAGGAGFVLEFGDMWETVPPIDIDNDGTVTAEEIVASAQPRFELDQDGNCISGCRNNGSRVQTHIIITGGWAGRIRGDYSPNMNTFVDRQGFLSDCTEIGADCIPLVLENYPTSNGNLVISQYRGDYEDYDIYFGNQPSGWIKYHPSYTP